MKNFYTTLIIILLIAAGFSSIWLIPIHIDNSESVFVASNGIQVVDSSDARYLIVDGRIKALVDTSTWRSYLRYVAVMDLPMQFYLNPGKMFLAGAGAGSIIKNYKHAGWSVDVAETDSEIISSAQKHFGLNGADAAIHLTDGRQFLSTHEGTYDIILLDAVNCGDYPVNMMTKEFFTIASSHLAGAGIFAVSLESTGWHDEIVSTLSATLRQCFSEVFVLPIVEPPNIFGSIVLFASNGTHNDFVRDPERNITFDPNWRYGPEYQKVHAWDNHFVTEESGVILTDAKPLSHSVADRLRQASRHVPKDYLP